MAGVTQHRVFELWKKHIDRVGWSAHILDAEWRLVWVSDELMDFLDCRDDDAIGIGLPAFHAYFRDAWQRVIHPESLMATFLDFAPYLVTLLHEKGLDPKDVLPEPFADVLDAVEPQPIVPVFSTSFRYVDPRPGREGTDFEVTMLYIRVHDDDGTPAGMISLSLPAVRPNLLALLSQGDREMYERMANLVAPRTRQAAILFCDLHESGRISRRLPSAGYFKLIRRLWTQIDAIVAEETGIVGKHAGDGASAFFLVEDLNTPSAAAVAALRAARRIQEAAADVFAQTPLAGCRMRIGLHWGSALYMGQLVPGQRLDVAALGDEVNEAARVEETAGPGETLVTKQLLEQLSPEDAAVVGVEVENVVYRLLGDLEGATDKAMRDAGGLAVTGL